MSKRPEEPPQSDQELIASATSKLNTPELRITGLMSGLLTQAEYGALLRMATAQRYALLLGEKPPKKTTKTRRRFFPGRT